MSPDENVQEIDVIAQRCEACGNELFIPTQMLDMSEKPECPECGARDWSSIED